MKLLHFHCYSITMQIVAFALLAGTVAAG